MENVRETTEVVRVVRKQVPQPEAGRGEGTAGEAPGGMEKRR